MKCETASTGVRSATNARECCRSKYCMGRRCGHMPFFVRLMGLSASSSATNPHAPNPPRTDLGRARCPRIGARHHYGAGQFISRTFRPISETVPCCRGTKCDFWEPFCTPSPARGKGLLSLLVRESQPPVRGTRFLFPGVSLCGDDQSSSGRNHNDAIIFHTDFACHRSASRRWPDHR